MDYRKIRFGQIGENETVKFAVNELKRCLSKMDDKLIIDILTVKKVDESLQNIIWVGVDDAFESVLPKVADKKYDDAVVISVKGSKGYITGTNERSVLISVYRFLKELGCGWVRPGKDGERIPEKEIKDVNVEVLETPSYRHRGIFIEGSNTYSEIADMIDFLPKINMNSYFIQFKVPSYFLEWHKFGNCPYTDEELSEEAVLAMTETLEAEVKKRGLLYKKVGHGWVGETYGIKCYSWMPVGDYDAPEHMKKNFALINGKRDPRHPLWVNLCYSNPSVRRKMVNTVFDYCKKNKNIDIIAFWLADGLDNSCECEKCSKLRPSDWYVMMLNALDKKLTRAGLKTKVSVCVYFDTLWAPIKEKLNNPDRFILLFAPARRWYGEGNTVKDFLDKGIEPLEYRKNKYNDPQPTFGNMISCLYDWQKNFSGDGVCCDYHLMNPHVGDLGYEAVSKNLFEDNRDLDLIGLHGTSTPMLHRCFFPTALPLHMMALPLWDKNADFEAKKNEYYKTAYGEGYEYVSEYLNTLSTKFIIYGGQSYGNYYKRDKGPFCTDYEAVYQAIEKMCEKIEEYKDNAGSCKKEWENLRLHCQYSYLIVKMYEMKETGQQFESKKYFDKLFSWILEHEYDLMDVYDASRNMATWRNRTELHDVVSIDTEKAPDQFV